MLHAALAEQRRVRVFQRPNNRPKLGHVELVRREQVVDRRLAAAVVNVGQRGHHVADNLVDGSAALIAAQFRHFSRARFDVGQVEHVGDRHITAVLVYGGRDLFLGNRLPVGYRGFLQRRDDRRKGNPPAELYGLAHMLRHRNLLRELRVDEACFCIREHRLVIMLRLLTYGKASTGREICVKCHYSHPSF